MSLKTKVNGFTSWANFRFGAVGHGKVENIWLSLFDGYNMKVLIESMTGRPLNKLKQFNGFSQSQRETRIQWVIDELIKCEIMDKKMFVDHRSIAAKLATEVFRLLWYLVCYDIYFLWIRSDFLQSNNITLLTSSLFTCIPPNSSSIDGHSNTILQGFLAQTEPNEKFSSKASAEKRDEVMINMTKCQTNNPPTPKECILQLINSHLKMTNEGKKLDPVKNFKDLVDSRVLCSLVNSIVPNTFTSEILLNDRWTVNLALQTIAEVSKCSCPFYAEDLVEADTEAVCSYFTFFFLSGYTLIQSRAAVQRVDTLNREFSKMKEELVQLPAVIYTDVDKKLKMDLGEKLDSNRKELNKLTSNFDIHECRSYVKETEEIQKQVWQTVYNAMKKKYEMVVIPSNMTVNELTNHMMINLSLTKCHGYYEALTRETITKDRKIIAMDGDNRFYDNDSKSGKKKKKWTSRYILGLSTIDVQDILPTSYPDHVIFLECLSNNKMLKAGSLYLYQIFPPDITAAQGLLFKSIKNNEFGIIKNIVSFFQNDVSFLNKGRGEINNTALHLACSHGRFQVVLLLLENNALVDVQNRYGNTPLFTAAENNHREICKLLIEYGANLYTRDRNSRTLCEILRNEDLKEFLITLFEFWRENSKLLSNGNLDVLQNIMNDHNSSKKKLSTLRSRCANGSTLLHVASYCNDGKTLKKLLLSGVDVNIVDKKHATPIHRARSRQVVEILMFYGGDINNVDNNGNTALHSRCFGEKDRTTDLDCIKCLIDNGIDVFARNKENLLAIHCAAKQGRQDAMELLLQLDKKQLVFQHLNDEKEELPPSVVYLALANDHLQCATWLVTKHFKMKDREADILIEKLFMQQISCVKPSKTAKFLYDNGASFSTIYAGGNTALHLVSCHIDLLEIMQLCLDNGCKVDAINTEQWTPLFFAIKSNNLIAARLLIERGASLKQRNLANLTPFDLIKDFDIWLNSKLFDKNTLDTLKAYDLKMSRDLVRSISYKIQLSELQSSMSDGAMKISATTKR